MKLCPALPKKLYQPFTLLYYCHSPPSTCTLESQLVSPNPQPVSAASPPLLQFYCRPPMLAKSVLHELPPATRRYHITRAKSKAALLASKHSRKFNINPPSTNVPLFSTQTNSFTRSPACFFTNIVLIWLRTRTTGYNSPS